MTDTDDMTEPDYYVGVSYNSTKLHADGGCFHLDRAEETRPALPHEVDEYEECSWCVQQDPDNGSGEGHYYSLKSAAESGGNDE